MFKSVLSFFLTLTPLLALESVHTPITFGEQRKALTKAYILEHYGIETDDIVIVPKIIVVHYTGIDDFDRSFKRFVDETLELAGRLPLALRLRLRRRRPHRSLLVRRFRRAGA